MWWLFFIAFMSGFAALLTPCVFPMIPMTVSFFTKQSKTKVEGIVRCNYLWNFYYDYLCSFRSWSIINFWCWCT